jgi:enoyl-CoA hydratase/carnithine racemase
MILTGKNWDAERSRAAGLIHRVVPHEKLQEKAWKGGEEIGRFDKVTLRYCKMAAHSSMYAANVPLAAEIAWIMQEEHALVFSAVLTVFAGQRLKDTTSEAVFALHSRPMNSDHGEIFAFRGKDHVDFCGFAV